MENLSKFIFTDRPNDFLGSNSLLIILPTAVSSKKELFDWYVENLPFPDCFGYNWDALTDSLCSLYELNVRRLVVHHEKLPFGNDVALLKVYLEILSEVLDNYRSFESNKNKYLSCDDGMPDEFIVSFATRHEQEVNNLFAG